jgi:hypothetical protein
LKILNSVLVVAFARNRRAVGAATAEDEVQKGQEIAVKEDA